MSKNQISKILATVTIYSLLVMTGCGQSTTGNTEPTTLPQETEAPAPTNAPGSESTPVPTSAAPESTPVPTETSVPGEEWKSNLGTIDLSNLRVSGTGITVDGATIRITSGGDFTVTGTLENGKIFISTTERVKLRLSGASISCNNDSAIFV